MDIKPRFRYLDEQEEAPPHVEMHVNFAEDGGHSEATRLVVADRYGSSRHFWDIGLEMLREKPISEVPYHIDWDTRWMRRLKTVFAVLTVVLFLCSSCGIRAFETDRFGSGWGCLPQRAGFGDCWSFSLGERCGNIGYK